MFRKKRKLDNSIAAPPFPRETIIHNHNTSSKAALFLALAAIGIAAFPLAWFGLVFVFDKAGADEPERAVAQAIIAGLVLLVVYLLALPVGNHLLAVWSDTRKEVEALRLEATNNRLRIAQAIPPTTAARMTKEESRLYMAIKMAMVNGYGLIDERGVLRSRAEPWSRRQVGNLRLLNETSRIGEHSNIAGQVRPWLIERRVISEDGHSINLAEYPNLSAVEAALIADFGQPVIYRAPEVETRAERFEHI